MKSSWWLSAAFALGFAAAASAQTGTAAGPPREVRLLVGDQFVLEPGFAVGDISVADPQVADYRVRPGRRAILLLGIGSGRTRLILWRQDGKTRSEVELVVETREQAEAENKLRVLLRDFPSVKVERVGSSLVVSGTVSSEDDLALIERMAQSVNAESFVRYTAPEGTAGGVRPPAAAAPAGGATGAPSSASATLPPVSGAIEIEYEVQVFEASITFGTSSYETGIEPSGRVLHAAKVRAPVGGNVEVFVPGKSLASKDIKIPANELQTGGIRLTLTPSALEDDQLSTRILVETNLPIKSSAYVPGGWRRARWESANAITAPFSVAGADLLVVPELSTGASTLSKISGAAGMLGGLPGVSSLPGAEYSGSVPYYNKDRKTHLLVLFRARVVAGR
jgi:Flp pilus assembly secretin CpaC